jgi:hypothetical protein
MHGKPQLGVAGGDKACVGGYSAFQSPRGRTLGFLASTPGQIWELLRSKGHIFSISLWTLAPLAWASGNVALMSETQEDLR